MSEKKRVIALGFFDGVHIGHGALLNKTRERAQQIGGEASVLTFDVHPDNLVFNTTVPLINSAAGRKEIIRRCFGISNVVFIHFNRKTMCMPWEEFAASIIENLNIGWIVVGHDFSFGHKGLGNAVKLREYCRGLDIGVDIIEPVKKDGIVVSSTYIRGLITQGDMERAREYLGHPHSLCDTVRSGYHLGTKMGAPTINMVFPEGVIIPRHGVYATKVFIEDGSSHIAVTNVGVRPTVSDDNRVNVESHLLDYSGNLYGSQVRVEFYSFIRPERKFDSSDELFAQIHRDTEAARAYFENTKHMS